MTWIREVCRRLIVFYVIFFGCLSIGQALEGYLLSEGIELYIAGPAKLFVYLFLQIWTAGQLKFEPIR